MKIIRGTYAIAHGSISRDNVEMAMVDTFLESFLYIFFPRICFRDILHFPDYPERNSEQEGG